jgi:hypothetical protein
MLPVGSRLHKSVPLGAGGRLSAVDVDNQEDFLVLCGECLLLIEGQQRRLKSWDFVAPGRRAEPEKRCVSSRLVLQPLFRPPEARREGEQCEDPGPTIHPWTFLTRTAAASRSMTP